MTEASGKGAKAPLPLPLPPSPRPPSPTAAVHRRHVPTRYLATITRRDMPHRGVVHRCPLACAGRTPPPAYGQLLLSDRKNLVHARIRPQRAALRSGPQAGSSGSAAAVKLAAFSHGRVYKYVPTYIYAASEQLHDVRMQVPARQNLPVFPHPPHRPTSMWQRAAAKPAPRSAAMSLSLGG